ncbi:beta strand repeat-containing protein [Lacipirellula parvula]|uniref:PEP-CTERM protein-sorting domain-containing protein n=1 Tax=Lacipirellula parvula TaxID=2650471 RepID=A0A5K7XE81_9BACT|nr:hypothetical protein [Lacipirellula parvula]BBO32553.1 hypothetical protein PLANPX_2165 [Lacipirellula parvula]
MTSSSPFARRLALLRRSLHSSRPRAFALALPLAATLAPTAHAALQTVGNVTPAPPTAGGNVAAPFMIGDSSVGSVSLNGATSINVTGGSATIGDDAGVSGILSLTGFNTNFTTASDIIVGNRGFGSLTASTQARVTMTDDLLLGIESGGKGDVFLDGFGTVLDVGDDFVIGQAGIGMIQISASAAVFGDATSIGTLATGEGSLAITGNGTLWRQDSTMMVGDAGIGTLQVLNQARMRTTNGTLGNVATGNGTANVSGASSYWEVSGTLTVGASGQGALSVLDGGRVSTTGVAKIASLAGSEATAVVSGAGSRLQVGTTFTVAEFGRGVLRVLAGGRVNSTNAIIADNAGARGEVFVDGANSVWEIAGSLDVSEPGEASLMISGGGLVTTVGAARIGVNGELALNGGRIDVGSAAGLNNQGLIRGGGRIGAPLTNTTAGEVRIQAGNVLVVNGALTNSGVINVDIGELESLTSAVNNGDIAIRTGALRFQGAGLDNNAGAQLAVTGGVADVLGAVDNNAGAQIVVTAKSAAIFHDAVTNNGQIHVMPGADAVMLENLSFSASSLLGLQLGAIDATDELGQVEVGGMATLAGTLDVKLAGSLTPKLGDSFRLLTATGGLTGTFATAALPALGSGLSWDLDYTSTALTLSVVAGSGFAADFDLDGDVDAADLAHWKTGFGKKGNAEPFDGDANGDFNVDGADYLIWQRQFGSGVPATPVAGAVPEPSAVAIAIIALMAVTPALRRRHLR